MYIDACVRRKEFAISGSAGLLEDLRNLMKKKCPMKILIDDAFR